MAEQVYAPSRGFGAFVVAIWLVTGLILFWLGFILEPADRDAMDGLQRLFFTIVPIKPFAWAMSIAFLGFAGATAKRVMSDTPALLLTDSFLETRKGERFTWSEVEEVESLKDQALRITVNREEAGLRVIQIGSFELGTAPAEVVEEIERRRSAHADAVTKSESA